MISPDRDSAQTRVVEFNDRFKYQRPAAMCINRRPVYEIVRIVKNVYYYNWVFFIFFINITDDLYRRVSTTRPRGFKF